MAGRDRAKSKRLGNILEEAEGKMNGIIANLQGFRRAKDDFYKSIEDLGVQGLRGYD